MVTSSSRRRGARSSANRVRPRRRLSIARMMIDEETIPTRNSIIWVIPSEPDDRRTGGESSSSTSVPASVTQRPKRSEGKFETGNFAVAWIGGSTTWRVCSTLSFGAGLRTMAVTINRRFTRRCAIWTDAWRVGRWRNTNASSDIAGGHLTGSVGLLCGLPCSLLTGLCCVGRRLDDKSRMSGDAHVRFRERLGVKLPRATRRLVHCRSEHEAQALKAALQARLAECRLEIHPTKTKIIYCKDGKRKGKYPNIKFDFLGYRFRPQKVLNSRDNSLFWIPQPSAPLR